MKRFFINMFKIPALYFAVLGLLLAPAYLSAQDTTKTEAPELLSPALEFVSVQKADNTIDLKVAMKTKFKGNFIKLPRLKVTFFQVVDTEEKELGHAITDLMGKAIFNVKADQLQADKEGKIHLKAAFAGNKSMETADGEVSFKRARLEITPVKGDSLNSAQVKLIDLTDGKETPIGNTAVGLFVKRSFFPLKIGEGTTDSTDGTASIDIPAKLPGDSAGNITLIGKVDENEVYGNLEASVVKNWGVAVSMKNQELPRALWSTHPPTWMLITFIILMTTVWGHYIVIIYELFRLRKEEPHVVPGTTKS